MAWNLAWEKKIINDLNRVLILSIPHRQKFYARAHAHSLNEKEMEQEHRDCNGIYSERTRCKMQYFLLYLSAATSSFFIVCFARFFTHRIVHRTFWELNAAHILGFRGRLKSTFALFMVVVVVSIFLAPVSAYTSWNLSSRQFLPHTHSPSDESALLSQQ